MQAMIDELAKQAAESLGQVSSKETLASFWQEYLSKNGKIPALMKNLRSVAPEERPAMGKIINELKQKVQADYDAAAAKVKEAELAARNAAETVDITLPAKTRTVGGLHPLTLVTNQIIDVFSGMGFADGAAFWQALQREEQPELVVLDVMLPGVDGMELLRRMRASAALRRIPVVMATAKGAEYDKIQGLDLGADYYLAKPFGVMELVSCVKAVLRRCRTEQEPVLRAGGIVLHPEERIVTVEGQRVTLTYKEFELLRLFLSHPGMAFTRDQLFNEIWGMDYCGETRTVDMHIRTLRQKLGSCGSMIQTVRNVGYRLEVGA